MATAGAQHDALNIFVIWPHIILDLVKDRKALRVTELGSKWLTDQ